MKPSSKSTQKLVQCCLGACLLVLAGMYLDCGKPKPIKIRISGSPPNFDVSPPSVTLNKATHDSVVWVNDSDYDVLVCMVDATPPPDYQPDAAGRAFVPTLFYIPRKARAHSGPVRGMADSSNMNYLHQYFVIDDPLDNPLPGPSLSLLCTRSWGQAIPQKR